MAMDKQKQPRTLQIEGDSIRDCLNQASQMMQVPKKYLSYRIVVKGRTGFLGIGHKKYGLEVYEDVKISTSWIDSSVSEAISVARARPGYFHIEYKDGFAYLKVFPPGEDGKSVRVEDIEERMKILRIEPVSRSILVDAIRESASEGIFLGAWTEGSRIDATVKIDISDDSMDAKATLFPPRRGGRDLSAEEIIVLIQKHGVIHGIIYENVHILAENKEYEIPVVVSKGTAPVPGKNAEIKYYFRAAPSIELKVDEKGKVDFKELDLIQNCKKNEILAEKILAKGGQDGKDVRSRTIRAPQGKDVELKAGKNVTLSPDCKSILAEIDGQVVMSSDGVISVEKVYTIDNVNYETGNINFLGSVIIKDHIEDGFSVKATGNIIIHKSIGKVSIESDNDVILKGGLLGKDEGYVKAGGNIYARFIENAHLYSLKDIHVQELIMHSNITTEGSLYLDGKRAALIGGKTIAGRNIIVKELGAVSEIATDIIAGVPPKLLNDLDLININVIMLGKKIIDANNAYLRFKKLDESGVNLTPKQRDSMEKLLDAITKLEQEKNTLHANEESLLRNFEPFPDAAVRVMNKAYKGVRLSIGHFKKILDCDYQYVSFKVDQGMIKEFVF